MPPPPARAEDHLAMPLRLSLWPAAARLVGLRPQDCRWPIGDVAAETFAFCAQARLPGGSYCARHKALAHRAAS